MATQNIPGVSFHYKDEGRFVPVVSGPITDTVLIIGLAVDGPVNTPVRVNAKNVEQVFGPVVYDQYYTSTWDAATAQPTNGDRDYGRYNGNSLVKAYAEVVQGGCTDIILMRVGDPEGTIAKQATPVIADTPDATGKYKKAATQTGDTLSTLLGVDITARYPGMVYNGIGIKLTYTVSASALSGNAYLEIHQELKRKGRVLTLQIADNGVAITKRQLIEKVNSDLRNNSIVAVSQANETNLDAAIPFNLNKTNGTYTSYFVLDGGTDGNRADFGTAKAIYEALMGGSDAAASGDPDEESAFARLETTEADIVLMAAIYADENIGDASNPQTIMVPFAKAIHTASKNDYPMIGVCGTKPVVDSIPVKVGTVVDNLAIAQYTGQAADAFADSAKTMLKLGYFLSMDPDLKTTRFHWIDPELNEVVDLGRYILCVGGPDVWLSNAKIGQYVDSGAGVYAGLLSTLPPYRAVTNMTLPGVGQLAWAFSNRQLNKVAGGTPYDEVYKESGAGGSYVLFRKNIAGNIVVNLDNSCASRQSDYASYQVSYIVNMVASGIKRVVEPFIGMAAHTTTKTALENQVRKFLDLVAETRAIAGGEGVGYDFAISASGVDQMLGRINIDLTLRPALQIKAVNVTISVAPPTGA